jgi:hypothetical protein
MCRILEDLFYGKIHPYERKFGEDKEFAEKTKAVIDIETELLKKLNEEEKVLLNRYSEAQTLLSEMTVVEYFKTGFKLGATIGMEIAQKDDNRLRDKT